MERPVRVRFAPSPTGPLHIGGVRTALYNYLFARRHGGTMILRIEDTDSQRFVPGAEEYILESLKWCGIEIDEGVGVGGPHAPYRQSERRDIYLKYAKQLVESGWAYYAFDTAEELDALRKEYEARGETFAYNYSIREKLPTSLSLSKEEVAARIARGDQWVIRFKMPENEIVEMDDLIRGHVEVNTSTLDDKVLYKSADALPTYHLANIVDDRLMEVSHVIGNQNRHDSRADIAKPHFGTCGIAQRIEHNGLALRSGAPDLLFDLHPYSPGFRLRSRLSIRRRVSSFPMKEVTSYIPGPLPAPTSARRSVFITCPSE